MTCEELMFRHTEAWVRVITLERSWGTPREEVLRLAWPPCRGDLEALNERLKALQKAGKPVHLLN